MGTMLKKLYRKLFPLKFLIRNSIKELRELINTKTTTLSNFTESIAQQKSETLKSQLSQKLDEQNQTLSAKMDAHRDSTFTSVQLMAADINGAIINHLTPVRVELSNQWLLMNEIHKNLHIVQNELRASQFEITHIKSQIDQFKSQDSVGAIKASTTEIRAVVNNDLKEAAIHLKAHVENIELGLETTNALAGYILARHDPKISYIGTYKDYAALRRGSSYSQLKQDLWVLWELKEKRHGFFVEIGATDGIDLSNTYLLEKDYEWTGILCEPQPFWLERLKKNRGAQIETRCVWSKTAETLLFAVPERKELGGILETGKSDMHATDRLVGEQIKVETISLLDLLREHRAPRHIDFLSIDTEGSEFEILSTFDFDEFLISLICVEHNYNKEQRQKIYTLLGSNGYVRKYENVSEFDDWYVRKT